MNNNTNKYILLVDDEKDILFLYNEWLKSDGYHIVSFDNPVEALNYLNKNDNISNCSLVITDYKMPQMSGIDLIKKIKDTNCQIRTIVISAFIKDNLPYDKSYITTVDRILEKPVYLDRLKKVIHELISTIDIQQKA